MKNVAIVYCGGISVSEDTKSIEGVYNIPTVLIDGEDALLINTDITPDEFYTQLRSGKRFKTSLPKLDMLEDLFHKLLKEYDEVVYITLSSQLSGTFQSGVLMSYEVDSARIRVFDSLTAIEGGEMFVREAAKLSTEGQKADDIIKHLESIRDNKKILFMVEDIDYLVKGGRIGKAAGSVANFLSIKPVLTLNADGQIDTFAKVRNTKKLMKKMFDEFNNLELTDKTIFTVVHSMSDLTLVNETVERLQNDFPSATVNVNLLSPIIGTHVGCEVIGIVATY